MYFHRNMKRHKQNLKKTKQVIGVQKIDQDYGKRFSWRNSKKTKRSTAKKNGAVFFNQNEIENWENKNNEGYWLIENFVFSSNHVSKDK